MLFKSEDESISIVHTKSKELSIVNVRNKKQRPKKQKAKIIVIDAEMRIKFLIIFLIRMHSGAYLGGSHWAMAPPLGSQDNIISIE